MGLALIFGSLKLSTTAWGTDDNPIINFVKKMVNGIVKVINWAIDGINEMFHIEFSGLVIGGVEIIPSFDKRLINIPKIPLLAEGGFPEQGQMFIAREAGAEMVGNIGRRTAVVNNEQIVASISGGVAEANEEQNALLREQNSLLRALLEKDTGKPRSSVAAMRGIHCCFRQIFTATPSLARFYIRVCFADAFISIIIQLCRRMHLVAHAVACV